MQSKKKIYKTRAYKIYEKNTGQEGSMKRAYYSDDIKDFLYKNEYEIFGELTSNDQFSAEDLQKNTWKKEIQILKRELADFSEGYLLFEYTIPRIGDRIDAVFLYKGIVFLLEFKVGESTYPSYAINQVTDYALDLNCFHKESHDKLLVPILICTKAPNVEMDISVMKDHILNTYCCNEFDIGTYIRKVSDKFHREAFDYDQWINSIYMPTPTIIEAAQALYMGHHVEDISRNDASAKNLKNLNHMTSAILL